MKTNDRLLTLGITDIVKLWETSLNFDSEGISYKNTANERPALNRFSDIQQVTVTVLFLTMRGLLLVTVVGAIFLRESFGKPTEMVANSNVLDPIASTVNNTSETETTREQRSPQFGLLGGYSDYDYNDDTRYFRYGSGRKYHHYKPFRPHKPHGLIGGYGCRGYGCGGGWQPDYGGHHHTGQGASFASASAGSIGGGGLYGGGQSQANAQSASFNIGPFSASFSSAQSSSGQNGF
ncbi:uncharacterized protein LOC105834128 [Monomorium pharaonis]|uniref:uncharacterized protein LOC105834128 n=1 Tax=Monomorium pharaonis TaxID=307658 RepID=UPI0017463F71|nr:uncharacterized protein LOC105834128 [Monomorium pharaonis]